MICHDKSNSSSDESLPGRASKSRRAQSTESESEDSPSAGDPKWPCCDMKMAMLRWCFMDSWSLNVVDTSHFMILHVVTPCSHIWTIRWELPGCFFRRCFFSFFCCLATGGRRLGVRKQEEKIQQEGTLHRWIILAQRFLQLGMIFLAITKWPSYGYQKNLSQSQCSCVFVLLFWAATCVCQASIARCVR